MSDTLRERIAEACCLAENGPLVVGAGQRGRGDVYYAMADAVLSVLHEAGEQGEGAVSVSRADLELALSDIRTTREPRPGDIPEGWSSARSRLRVALVASPVVAGEQESDQ